MKILILADPVDDQSAGIHVYTKNLIENLLKIDRKNRYFFIHKRKNSFFDKTNHYVIPHRKIPFYGKFRKFFLIPYKIRKIKPDIVVEPCHMGPFNLPKSIKRVTVIHDLTPITMPHLHDPGSARRHKFFLKKILKKADLIITNSETSKKDIQKFIPSAKNIAVIPLAPALQPSPSRKAPLKSPYLLYLGTIEPRKNLETLIRAFLELKKSQKIPHKLVLAGALGWKYKKITLYEHADIIFKTHIPESQKQNWLKHADIFVYPSLYEGFGLPPLEAMRCQTPVITSTGGSLKELYANYALQHPPTNIEILKSQILKLIKNLQQHQKFTEKAYQYSKRFSWKQTAQKTLHELEKLYHNSNDENFKRSKRSHPKSAKK